MKSGNVKKIYRALYLCTYYRYFVGLRILVDPKWGKCNGSYHSHLFIDFGYKQIRLTKVPSKNHVISSLSHSVHPCCGNDLSSAPSFAWDTKATADLIIQGTVTKSSPGICLQILLHSTKTFRTWNPCYWRTLDKLHPCTPIPSKHIQGNIWTLHNETYPKILACGHMVVHTTS